MKALLIKTAEAPAEIVSVDGTLKSLQRHVGGFIEVVACLQGGGIVLADEEGWLKGLLPSRVLLSDRGEMMSVAGPLLIVGDGGDCFTGLTDAQIGLYRSMAETTPFLLACA